MQKLTTGLNQFTKSEIESIDIIPVPTGIKPIDKATGGGLRPGITVLGARPGAGKTTLALQIGLNVSKSGRPVLLYSLEIPKVRVQAKLISHLIYSSKHKTILVKSSDILNPANREKTFTKEHWNSIEAARGKLSKYAENFYIFSEGSVSASQISKEVIDFIARRKKEAADQSAKKQSNDSADNPLVIIDYLQFLSKGDNSKFSDRQAVDESVKILTELAKEHKVPVLLISALNRASYDDDEEEITMGSFKESGSIEYSADALIGMQTISRAGDKRVIKLSFLKQRYGDSNISILLDYFPGYDTFEGEENQEPQDIVGTKKKDRYSLWFNNKKKEEKPPVSIAADTSPLEVLHSLTEEKHQ